MEETWFNESDFSDSDSLSFVDYDISVAPNDFNINTIFSLVESGIIQMPVFQRKYVWDIKRASKLIESIIMGLPIPQLFFYQSEKNNFLVIDGQQRLLSIYFFVKQRFPTDEGKEKLHEILSGGEKILPDFIEDDRYFKDFKLTLPKVLSGGEFVSHKLAGLKFATLDSYKHTFEFMRTIRCMVVKQNSPTGDIDSIFEIFNRLNTGGQNLLPQEIRMSLFYSKFYVKLLELNRDSRWRKILNLPKIDLHFKDIEILLRCFGMLAQYDNYSAPMNNFLNKFSALSRNFEDDNINYFANLFDAFLSCCRELGRESFLSKSGKFSISLFEAVFVAVCDKSFRKKEFPTKLISEEQLTLLKCDLDFIKATQESVASKSSVQLRIETAKKYLG